MWTFGCGNEAQEAIARNEAQATVARSLNSFSANFVKIVAGNADGNVVCSPISASMVLSMAAFGARGNTEKQLRTALAFPDDDAVTKDGFQALVDSFTMFTKVELRLANKMFINQLGFWMKPDFQHAIETYFRSPVQSVDFGNATGTSGIINDWAERQTNHRIKNIVSSDSLGIDTAMVLINAVYFKGHWANPFKVNQTQPRAFYVNATTVKNIPTMYRLGYYGYGELHEVNAKFVELPYKCNDTRDSASMFIVLPNEIDGLADLENNLEKVTVEKLFRGRSCDVKLYLPKFKIENTFDLQEPLQKMGMTDMFLENGADFTGIADNVPSINRRLYVSKVVQKAFIEVNEEGSEAAAATAVVFQGFGSAMPQKPPPITFRVDHPFLYAIVLRPSRTIIFQGHYRN